jgi:hypothetical protein
MKNLIYTNTIYALVGLMLIFAAACLTQEQGNPSGGSAATGKVTLSWSANAGEQQGFLIEQSSDGTNFTQVQTVPDGTNTATITGLLDGATYSFRIRGYNASGDSPYTSIVMVSIK